MVGITVTGKEEATTTEETTTADPIEKTTSEAAVETITKTHMWTSMIQRACRKSKDLIETSLITMICDVTGFSGFMFL